MKNTIAFSADFTQSIKSADNYRENIRNVKDKEEELKTLEESVRTVISLLMKVE